MAQDEPEFLPVGWIQTTGATERHLGHARHWKCS